MERRIKLSQEKIQELLTLATLELTIKEYSLIKDILIEEIKENCFFDNKIFYIGSLNRLKKAVNRYNENAIKV